MPIGADVSQSKHDMYKGG